MTKEIGEYEDKIAELKETVINQATEIHNNSKLTLTFLATVKSKFL